jgi:hypothetical protein
MIAATAASVSARPLKKKTVGEEKRERELYPD